MERDLLQHNALEDDLQVESDVPVWDHMLGLLSLASRHIALLAAWIATCGSLFMSEVLGWQPCVLCWYQRISMYPLALILAIGIVRRDRAIHSYVLPFSVIGAGISLYHYLLIKTDWFPPPPCTVGIPCTVDYLDWFGFINVPFLALVAFLIITLMMSLWSLIPPAPEADAQAVPSAPFDSARLAVGMIIVAVVLTFMLASTFI